MIIMNLVQAQQKEGRVVYERTAQLQLRIAGMGDEVERMVPRSRTDKLEVLFGNNQSLRRVLQDDVPEEETGGGPGVQIRIMGAGVDDITWYNFSTGQVTEQREFATKKYLVADSVRKLNWKLTGESKNILGQSCQKAIAQNIGQRSMMNMDNGQMKRETVADTMNIIAWFAPAIPVPAGPDYQGQLPGLIMEVDVNNGRMVYKAIELSPKTDVATIKEPKSGKKVTAAEFATERDKLMEEMQRNNGGRGRTIRISN
jgi:GLPGLI family protein